jgi:pimeloyl-ACP methyl ester carboxylesterase
MTQAIIIIGGFNSLWPAYLTMARHLEDISGLQAVGVPLMPWHWWVAARHKDATNILHELEETVAWARRRFHAGRFILVGHSAGGLIARLYLHQEPVWGHVYAGVEHVDAVITLGSPHCADRGTATGWYLSDEANRLLPGTPYAGRVRYRAVAGRAIEGRRYGRFRQRQAFRAYTFFAGQGDVWGDGTVPLDCMRLDGAETVILQGVSHSLKTSRHWYGGSPAIIRRWWPQELTDAR